MSRKAKAPVKEPERAPSGPGPKISEIVLLDVVAIRANAWNANEMAPAAFDQLCEDVQTYGFDGVVTVAPVDEGPIRWQVVDGERGARPCRSVAPAVAVRRGGVRAVTELLLALALDGVLALAVFFIVFGGRVKAWIGRWREASRAPEELFDLWFRSDAVLAQRNLPATQQVTAFEAGLAAGAKLKSDSAGCAIKTTDADELVALAMAAPTLTEKALAEKLATAGSWAALWQAEIAAKAAAIANPGGSLTASAWMWQIWQAAPAEKGIDHAAALALVKEAEAKAELARPVTTKSRWAGLEVAGPDVAGSAEDRP